MHKSEHLPFKHAIALSGHSLLFLAMPFVAFMAFGAANDEAKDGQLTVASWILVGIGSGAGLGALWDVTNLLRDVGLARWLYRNRVAIRAGGARRDGTTITLTTRLVRYRAHLGLFVFGLSRQSAYRVERASVVDHVLSDLVSLVCGWWALPFGPMRVWAALRENVRGPVVYHVRELLDAMDGLVPAHYSGHV